MTETRLDRMDRRDGALLRKVGDTIFAEPERYQQKAWAMPSHCGTVACLASATVTLVDGFEAYAFDRSWGRGTDEVYIAGALYTIEEAAQDALGLTDDEWPLFEADWKPAGDPSHPLHERVCDALYALADGATVEEVSA